MKPSGAGYLAVNGVSVAQLMVSGTFAFRNTARDFCATPVLQKPSVATCLRVPVTASYQGPRRIGLVSVKDELQLSAHVAAHNIDFFCRQLQAL